MSHETDDLLALLRELYPDLDIEPLQARAGGRKWYIPSPRRRLMAEKKALIRRDPCRDYKVIKRRYCVSVALIYSVWNEASEPTG
jgi:Mor family transcriptional regulator